MQHVVGVAADGDFDVVEDDREALRVLRRVRDLEIGLHVAAAEAVLVRHDGAVRKGTALDEQRHELEPAAARLTLLRLAATSRRLLGGHGRDEEQSAGKQRECCRNLGSHESPCCEWIGTGSLTKKSSLAPPHQVRVTSSPAARIEAAGIRLTSHESVSAARHRACAEKLILPTEMLMLASPKSRANLVTIAPSRQMNRSSSAAVVGRPVGPSVMAAMMATMMAGALAPAYGAGKAPERVDLELMTWPEVRRPSRKRKTTALVFNGGTETRGPQAVNGGHTFVAHAKVVAIARALGNAIAAPVLPFSPNRANAELPGTIGLSVETYQQINREIAEQLIGNGFKNVVLMGDHGGGQKQLAELAKDLDARYSPQGIRVVYCEDVYKKSNEDFDAYIASKGLSAGGHASINDTSEMMFLEPSKNAWVRRDKLAEAVGTERRAPGAPVDPNAPPPNGVSGDGRKAAAEIGKVGYEMHVDQAVAQIRQLLGGK